MRNRKLLKPEEKKINIKIFVSVQYRQCENEKE